MSQTTTSPKNKPTQPAPPARKTGHHNNGLPAEFLSSNGNGDLSTLVSASSDSTRFRGLSIAKWGLILVFAAGFAWAGGSWLLPDSGERIEITAEVIRGTLPITVTERGEIESAKTVTVQNDVEGRQTKLVEIVPEGTTVKKGSVVVRFDTEELTRLRDEQAVRFSEAEGKAKQAKEEVEVQVTKGEGEIEQAESALTLAELDLEKYKEGDYKVELSERNGAIKLAQRDLEEAKQKLANTRELAQKGFKSSEQVRVLEAEVQNKEYYLERDTNKLSVLINYDRRRKITELEDKARDAKRTLERAQRSAAASKAKAELSLSAELRTARLQKERLDRLDRQIEKCIIKAPQDGIVIYYKRHWDDESRIRPGAVVYYQQPIFSLPDLTKMQVKLRIHESVINKVKKGMKTNIIVDARPELDLKGTVKSVAVLADSDRYWDEVVKEYTTIVNIDNLPIDAGLKPGMRGEATISVNELKDVLMVPVQAVTEKDDIKYAYVVQDGTAEQREVVTGENNEKFVEIVTGLGEGERVALDARARITSETDESQDSNPDTVGHNSNLEIAAEN